MAAITVDASPAADPGPRGPGPDADHLTSAADRPSAAARPFRAVRSWPLLVLAAPAAADKWSGWVASRRRPNSAWSLG
jgi:hypothetical protein